MGISSTREKRGGASSLQEQLVLEILLNSNSERAEHTIQQEEFLKAWHRKNYPSFLMCIYLNSLSMQLNHNPFF